MPVRNSNRIFTCLNCKEAKIAKRDPIQWTRANPDCHRDGRKPIRHCHKLIFHCSYGVKVLFGVLGLAWSVPALAWIAIATNDANINFEIDETSIKKRGSVVKFFEKITYLQPVEIDSASGKTIHQKKVHRIVNCANNTQGVLQGTLYGENRSLIESVSFVEAKLTMQQIPPGTVAQAELDFVCKAAGVPQKAAGQ